jgi:RNA polymerase sigma-32 factor
MNNQHFDEIEAFETIKIYKDFFQEIKHQLPDIDQATILKIKELAENAIEARDKIVEKYQKFVMKLAHKKTISEIKLEDLVSEGNMALNKAVETYNLDHNASFMTYATKIVDGAIIRSIYKHDFPINYPEQWITLSNKLNKFLHQNKDKYDSITIRKMFMDEHNINEKTLNSVEDMYRISQNYEDFMDKNKLTSINFISISLNPELQMVKDARDEAILRSIESLSEKKKAILDALVEEDEKISVIDVANKFNLSIQRVYQIRKEILKELNKHYKEDIVWNRLVSNVKKLNRTLKF